MHVKTGSVRWRTYERKHVKNRTNRITWEPVAVARVNAEGDALAEFWREFKHKWKKIGRADSSKTSACQQDRAEPWGGRDKERKGAVKFQVDVQRNWADENINWRDWRDWQGRVSTEDRWTPKTLKLSVRDLRQGRESMKVFFVCLQIEPSF